jgi:hypothetical protein
LVVNRASFFVRTQLLFLSVFKVILSNHSRSRVTTDIYSLYISSSDAGVAKIIDDLTPNALEFSSISAVDEECLIEQQRHKSL